MACAGNKAAAQGWAANRELWRPFCARSDIAGEKNSVKTHSQAQFCSPCQSLPSRRAGQPYQSGQAKTLTSALPKDSTCRRECPPITCTGSNCNKRYGARDCLHPSSMPILTQLKPSLPHAGTGGGNAVRCSHRAALAEVARARCGRH